MDSMYLSMYIVGCSSAPCVVVGCGSWSVK